MPCEKERFWVEEGLIEQGQLIFGERKERARDLKTGCFGKEDDYVREACLGSSVAVSRL